MYHYTNGKITIVQPPPPPPDQDLLPTPMIRTNQLTKWPQHSYLLT